MIIYPDICPTRSLNLEQGIDLKHHEFLRSVGSQGFSCLEAMRNSYAITGWVHRCFFGLPPRCWWSSPMIPHFKNLCCWCETSRCFKRRNAHMAMVKYRYTTMIHHDSSHHSVGEAIYNTPAILLKDSTIKTVHLGMVVFPTLLEPRPVDRHMRISASIWHCVCVCLECTQGVGCQKIYTLYIYTSIYLSVCLSVYLSVYLI